MVLHLPSLKDIFQSTDPLRIALMTWNLTMSSFVPTAWYSSVSST